MIMVRDRSGLPPHDTRIAAPPHCSMTNTHLQTTMASGAVCTTSGTGSSLAVSACFAEAASSDRCLTDGPLIRAFNSSPSYGLVRARRPLSVSDACFLALPPRRRQRLITGSAGSMPANGVSTERPSISGNMRIENTAENKSVFALVSASPPVTAT